MDRQIKIGCGFCMVVAGITSAKADSITVANIPYSTSDFGYLSPATNSAALKVDLAGVGGETINGTTFNPTGTFSGATNPATVSGTGTGTVNYVLSGITLTVYPISNGFPPGPPGDVTPQSNTAGSTNPDPTIRTAINTLMGSFVYGGADQSQKSETLTINGLTPNETATLTILGAAFGRGTVGGREESISGTAGATVTNYTDPNSTPVNSYEENNGQFSTVTYTALVPASGTISFTSVATDTVPSTLHYYAFTVVQTPEPAALGLIGAAGILFARRRRCA